MSRDEKLFWENQKKRSNKKEKENERKFADIQPGNTGNEVKAYYGKFCHC